MRDRLYTTADLARVCGVSISTIKRWTDSGVLRCVRTPGGHRKFRVQDVAQAARQLGTTLAQAEASAPDELAVLLAQSSRETLCERARLILERGDAQALLHFGLELHRHGMRLSAAAQRVLLRAWAEITTGSPDAFVTRRARRLTERALFHLLDQVPAPNADAPRAVLGGAPGSTEPLPLAVAHLALAEADWSVTDLGPDVPDGAWVAAVETLSPRLVVIGCTQAEESAAEALGARLGRPDVRVTVYEAESLGTDAIEALLAVAAAARPPLARPGIARPPAARLLGSTHLGLD
jgi:excisionase family DNA binding protein